VHLGIARLRKLAPKTGRSGALDEPSPAYDEKHLSRPHFCKKPAQACFSLKSKIVHHFTPFRH